MFLNPMFMYHHVNLILMMKDNQAYLTSAKGCMALVIVMMINGLKGVATNGISTR